MTTLLSARVSAVLLSRGSTWNPQPFEPPYLMPDDAAGWPAGTAQCVFYDTAGGVLATVNGTVAAGGITFTAAPAVVDLIPAGANFEIFLTVGGAPYQIRYGKVLRREAQFTAQPAAVTSPLAFTDSWPTTGLRSAWIVLGGTPIVMDNSGVSLPNGVQNFSSAIDTVAAIRWYKPLATDTVSVKVTLNNRYTYPASLSCKTRVVLAANTSFTSFLAVEFEAGADGAGVHFDRIHFCTGTTPFAVAYQGSVVNSVVANGDEYTVHYDDPTSTLSVYKGTSTTPLGSWVDATHIVPHGPGYRYVGLSFDDPVGPIPEQITSWHAIDTA